MNQEQIKESIHRRNKVLQYIREHEDACKTNVQRALHLGMESTIALINQLLEDRLIETAGISDAPLGRKSTLLQINANGQFFLGLRFNAEKIWMVVYNFCLEEVVRKEIALSSSVTKAEMISTLIFCISTVQEQMGEMWDRLVGIGVAASGINDYEKGSCKLYVHIPEWNNIPLAAILNHCFDKPVMLDNSARCMLMALKMQNPAIKNAVMIWIGRGVGCAVMTNGCIFRGSGNLAGNLAHIPVANQRRLCECGRYDCLETIVGHRALRKRIQTERKLGYYRKLGSEWDDGKGNIRDLAKLAEGGDADTAALIREIGKAVGNALSGVISLMNPERVIVIGKLTETALFRQSLTDVIQEKCFREYTENLKIEAFDCDDFQSAGGAAAMVFEQFYMA